MRASVVAFCAVWSACSYTSGFLTHSIPVHKGRSSPRSSNPSFLRASSSPRAAAVMAAADTEMSPEEVKLMREKRKEEKAAAKAAKAAKKAAAAAAASEEEGPPAKVAYGQQPPDRLYGDWETISSQCETGWRFDEVGKLGEEDGAAVGSSVRIRGRVSTIRAKGGSCFLVVRRGLENVQVCYFKDKSQPEESKRMLSYLASLTRESVVDVWGDLVAAAVAGCSRSEVEIQLSRCHAVSRAADTLPFLLEDAARSEAEIAASESSERPFPRVTQETRLDARWLDLRTPASGAIMHIQSAICQLFREGMYSHRFMEVHSPKLLSGGSEGGADVFQLDYFGSPACLAQSPQLYKQMCIASDMPRVFEIGPVFRAEKSHTRRHLTEFTGVDFEMEIGDHYNEVIAVLHDVFVKIFDGLEDRCKPQLQVIRQQFPSQPVQYTEQPVILHWHQAMEMLQQDGLEIDPMGDLTTATELRLGELVKEKHNTDFFFLDQYPSSVRPFYTMTNPADRRYSNSYDVFIRGQEICSGAQRNHDVDELLSRLKEMEIAEESLQPYIDSFRHGVSPHGGAGIGLERVVFLYLGLDNVRKASLFPRDPNRCSP